MKRFVLLLSFIFVTSTSFGQLTDDEIQDYVDLFLVAIGTEIPDVTGGMASALGAAPGVIKRSISTKCHQNMQNIEIELLDNNYSPERFLELNELYIRAQAINSAINGDSKPLLDFEKNKKKKMKEREEEIKRKEKEKKKKEREEEKDNMVIMLDIYQDEINKLKASVDELIKKGRSNSQNAKSKLYKVREYLEKYHDAEKERNNLETVQSVFEEKGKIFCDEAHRSQDKINELYNVLKDGEDLINSKIDQANGRAANCTKNEDALFVIEKYKEAKQAFAILKKGKEGAFEKLVIIKVNLEQINKINNSIEDVNTNKKKNAPISNKQWKINYRNINTILTEILENLNQLEFGFSQEQVINSKRDVLKQKIKDSKQYYITFFPKSETRYNQLIGEISRIYLEYDYHVISQVALSDLRQTHQQYENTYLLMPSGRDGKTNLQSIKCLKIKKSQKEIDKIEEIYFRSLLVIKANEHLSAGCTPIVPETTQNDTDEEKKTANNSIKPTVNSSDTEENDEDEKTIFGGLIIGGPSSVTVGGGVQFVALDGAGDPYLNQGGFTWLNTRQDLIVLSSSGGGKAFRAGRATIILKFDGKTVYKDIEIKEKKGDDNKAPLTEKEVEEDKELKEKCYNLIDQLTLWIHASNVEMVRSYTNRALALGCDVNAGAVNELIAEMEDDKREEQEQLDREYAAQEQERQLVADSEKAERRKNREKGLINLLDFVVKGIEDVNEEFDKDKRTANNDNNTKPFPTSGDIPNNPDKIGVYYPGTGADTQKDIKTSPFDKNPSDKSSTQNGMSKTDCEKKFCPPCSEENNPIDLLGVQVNKQCNQCRKKYKSQIEKCYKGGASANSPDKNLSEFRTYTVNKCIYFVRTKYNGGYYNKKHTFYEYYGPMRPNNNALSKHKITCTVISKGTWHECKKKVDNLKKYKW